MTQPSYISPRKTPRPRPHYCMAGSPSVWATSVFPLINSRIYVSCDIDRFLPHLARSLSFIEITWWSPHHRYTIMLVKMAITRLLNSAAMSCSRPWFPWWVCFVLTLFSAPLHLAVLWADTARQDVVALCDQCQPNCCRLILLWRVSDGFVTTTAYRPTLVQYSLCRYAARRYVHLLIFYQLGLQYMT